MTSPIIDQYDEISAFMSLPPTVQRAATRMILSARDMDDDSRELEALLVAIGTVDGQISPKPREFLRHCNALLRGWRIAQAIEGGGEG